MGGKARMHLGGWGGPKYIVFHIAHSELKLQDNSRACVETIGSHQVLEVCHEGGYYGPKSQMFTRILLKNAKAHFKAPMCQKSSFIVVYKLAREKKKKDRHRRFLAGNRVKKGPYFSIETLHFFFSLSAALFHITFPGGARPCVSPFFLATRFRTSEILLSRYDLRIAGRTWRAH